MTRHLTGKEGRSIMHIFLTERLLAHAQDSAFSYLLVGWLVGRSVRPSVHSASKI
jgi:hypothetical protein